MGDRYKYVIIRDVYRIRLRQHCTIELVHQLIMDEEHQLLENQFSAKMHGYHLGTA